MACITALEQDTQNDVWKGIALKTGDVKTFKTLDDYNRYVKALEDKGTYCAEIEPQYNLKYYKKEFPQNTGFMEFKVRDPEKQAKYSAMSSTWEGVESSEAAVARGDYSLDSAEAIRQELRATHTPQPRPVVKAATTSCVIQ